MKKIILTPENIDEIIGILNTTFDTKKYWLGLGMGKCETIQGEGTDWFCGKGTFERIIYLKAVPSKYREHPIQIVHKSAINELPVVPNDMHIKFGSEIMIIDSDVLIFEDEKMISKRGGTHLYMEWTVSRNEYYLSGKYKYVLTE